MRAMLFAVMMVTAPALAQAPPSPREVTYTNEEEVYFQKEAKEVPSRWLGARVNESTGNVRFVNANGSLAAQPQGAWLKTDDLAIRKFRFPDGRITTLRRARDATCWVAIPKTAKKPDGSDDWFFLKGLKIHDQGGRLQFGGGGTGAAGVMIRMRNVIWPSGPSQASLVLYVHKPESPDRAESYSWADPGAKRIGINLRWMQASCTID